MASTDSSEVLEPTVWEEAYAQIRSGNQDYSPQSYLTAPSARKFVQRFLQDHDANAATEPLKGRLAVVTGVARGLPGYYVAEEMAAFMDVVIVVDTFSQSLEHAIGEEGIRRRVVAGARDELTAMPKIRSVEMTTNSLQSVQTAAQQIEFIAREYYQGQIHLVVNMTDEISDNYTATAEGVESNMGRNYLAPRLLGDLLLPCLRQAAASSDDFTPRLIQQASAGHCVGVDFDPPLLRSSPATGGSCTHVMRNADTEDYEFTSETSGLELYYQSKMALMTDMQALAQEEPMIAVACCDSGILLTSSRQSMMGFSASQGARSALRAALDPELNNNDDDDEMVYLHSDANQWIMAENETEQNVDEFVVRQVGEQLCGELLADNKECDWLEAVSQATYSSLLSWSDSVFAPVKPVFESISLLERGKPLKEEEEELSETTEELSETSDEYLSDTDEELSETGKEQESEEEFCKPLQKEEELSDTDEELSETSWEDSEDELEDDDEVVEISLNDTKEPVVTTTPTTTTTKAKAIPSRIWGRAFGALLSQ